MRRRTLTILGPLLALAMLAGPVTPAHATPNPGPNLVAADDPQPPAGYPSWDALYAQGNKINDAITAIQAAATAAGDTGYAASDVDPTAATALLYWYGTPKPAVQQAISTAQATIPLTVRSALYPETLIISEVERLSNLSTKFYSVEPLNDASGVSITWAVGQEDPALAASTAATAAVAVFFAQPAPDQGNDPLSASRRDDDSPFSAGARTRICTTGFAMNHPSGTKLLSAAHCGSVGTAVYDAAGDPMGTVGAGNGTRDTAYINVLAAGKMWDGGVQSTFYKWVQDALPSRVGTYVCTSGGDSGVICNGKITGINLKSAGYKYQTRIKQMSSGKAMAGKGDSGGPVFSVAGSKVRAIGIISNGQKGTEVTCTGLGGRTCYREIYVADVVMTLKNFGGSIRTTG